MTLSLSIVPEVRAQKQCVELPSETIPVCIKIVSGDNQSGLINTPLSNPLVVRVTVNDSPVKGSTVTWQTTGGTLSAGTTTTDANGQTQTTLTLGATLGPVKVTASVAGGGSVSFSINNGTQANATQALQQVAQLGNLAVNTATVQSTNISLRLASLRRGAKGVSISGLSLNVDGQSVPVTALASLFPAFEGGGASADQSGLFSRLGIFINGQGTFGDQTATSNEPGFDFHTIGTTLGVDYRFTDHFILGTAFGYVSTKSEFDAAAGDFSARGFSGSVFGTYYVADGAYIDAIATYGQNDYDTTRNIAVPGVSTPAIGSTDGNQFSVSVSGGYNFNIGAFTLGPSGRVTYTRVHVDRFRESGDSLFAMDIDSQKVRSVTTDLGGRLSYAISTPWGVVTPYAHAEWEHEFKGGSRSVTGSFVADPLGTVFAVKTSDPDRNYVNIGGGFSATLPGGKSAFIAYEAIVGRNHFTHHTLNAGIRFEF